MDVGGFRVHWFMGKTSSERYFTSAIRNERNQSN